MSIEFNDIRLKGKRVAKTGSRLKRCRNYTAIRDVLDDQLGEPPKVAQVSGFWLKRDRMPQRVTFWVLDPRYILWLAMEHMLFTSLSHNSVAHGPYVANLDIALLKKKYITPSTTSKIHMQIKDSNINVAFSVMLCL